MFLEKYSLIFNFMVYNKPLFSNHSFVYLEKYAVNYDVVVCELAERPRMFPNFTCHRTIDLKIHWPFCK